MAAPEAYRAISNGAAVGARRLSFIDMLDVSACLFGPNELPGAAHAGKQKTAAAAAAKTTHDLSSYRMSLFGRPTARQHHGELSQVLIGYTRAACVCVCVVVTCGK